MILIKWGDGSRWGDPLLRWGQTQLNFVIRTLISSELEQGVVVNTRIAQNLTGVEQNMGEMAGAGMTSSAAGIDDLFADLIGVK